MADKPDDEKLSTGIDGLDEVLEGGFLPQRAYLVRGTAGTGKTTIGYHFLTAGVARGERSLLITLGAPESRIRSDAESFGFDLNDIPVIDLTPEPDFFTKSQTYDIFSPADVEREPITQRITQQIESQKPERVFVDAISQFRYLASDPQQFHKQTLAFLHYLTEMQATVLFTSEFSPVNPDDDLQFLCDGILNLENAEHGRTLRVSKFRGSGFQEGAHALRITGEGMNVYPRLLPESHHQATTFEPLSSGVAGLDEMLHGGLERGTATLITGPAGVGKSTLAMHFIREAARRGEHSVAYLLEESVMSLTRRCETIGIPVEEMTKQGTLSLKQVEPHRYMPEEFARIVRHEVESQKARFVVLDSMTGYRAFLRGDNLLTDLHTLCQYLQNMGVTVLLTNEVQEVAGGFHVTEHGVSYLAGNVIYMRYMERRLATGALEVRRCVGVLKKRLSDYEKSVRELQITTTGIKVGEPLMGLQSVLSAMPVVSE
ncbi:ATPase domain-containing protein [Rubinisphaera margarita]|uniref:ATPase domain-containing protein n=1 Tax=Rubinisphaera margarita TaxID=2909586 RepID=UPI001EE9371F|nr:ATPase domain-containing protein [Rubinisphaera margarita]MCG6158151.1 AAA family ATPase [Rubinisphaera margarita]